MLAARVSLVSLAGLVLAGASFSQQTWFVDVHATPPGDGSPQSPYASVQYAVDQPTTMNGDRLLLAPGVYPETVATHYQNITITGSKGAALTKISGGVSVLGGNAILEGLTLGSVFVDFSFGTVIERCVLSGSHWGLYVGLSNVYLRRSTVVDNQVGIEVKWGDGYLELENTVVWGNQSNDWGIYTICADYCAGQLPPASCGVGKLGNPGIWDPFGDDAHLAPGSPCIDAADPSLPRDPDGSPADIGAIPYDPRHVPTPTRYCNSKKNSQGCKPTVYSEGPSSVSNPLPHRVRAAYTIGGETTLLWYSVAGPANALSQGLKHCTAAPRKLALVGPAQGSSTTPCAGSLALDFNVLVQSGVDPALTAGAMVYVQCWYRDPLDTNGWGTGWSNALRFGIGL